MKDTPNQVNNTAVESAGACRRIPIHPLTKLRLAGDKAFFGPGTQQLLELVEQTGSLQEACLSMKLSYSKGSRMIKDAERQLGFRITQRWAGGAGGGGSELTEDGKQFLQNFRNMALDVQEYTDQIYIKHFGNISINCKAEEKERED